MLNRKHKKESKNKISEKKKKYLFSDEHKKNLSESHKGKKINDVVKKKMSESQKKIKRNSLSEETKQKIKSKKIGVKLSEQTKHKMSESHKGVKNHFFGKQHSNETLSKTRKPILLIDDNNNVIREYAGVNLAAKELGIKQSGISLVLSGKYKTTKGLKFVYKNGE